jgi:hypothetical protein
LKALHRWRAADEGLQLHAERLRVEADAFGFLGGGPGQQPPRLQQIDLAGKARPAPPPAPTLFSMTTGTQVGPPAENGTTSVMDRLG